jgi:hypothetical protein
MVLIFLCKALVSMDNEIDKHHNFSSYKFIDVYAFVNLANVKEVMKCSMLYICQEIVQWFHYYLLHKLRHLLSIIGHDHVHFFYFEIQLQNKNH